MEGNKKIFISYSWSNMDVADEIEADLAQLQIELIRDVRDIEYRSSISRFMENIRDSDYAILLISESYLKSKNCMKEVLHILKERDYENKILPVIIGSPPIYDIAGRIEFTKYWQQTAKTIRDTISSLPPTSIVKEIEELKGIEEIAAGINDFLAYVSDIKNIAFSELKGEGYRSILEAIGCTDVTHLVSLLRISFTSELDKREVMLDEWFEKYKPNSDAYSLRASIASERENDTKAEINFKKALDLNPDNAFALNNYGYWLQRKDKEPEKARELFEHSIKIMPNLTPARLNLGCLLTEKFNDLEGAKRQYEEVIVVNPTEERAYNNLANVYKQISPKNLSTQSLICELYEKAISLNSRYIAARLGYGTYLSEFLGEFDRAEAELDEVVNIDPNAKEFVGIFKERINSFREKAKPDKNPRNKPCHCGSGKKYKKCHGKNSS